MPWPSRPLIGPLASWELLRLARCGQGHRARLMVLYLIFLGFVLTPLFWFAPTTIVAALTDPNFVVPLNESREFGRMCALALLEAVTFAVVLITPAYAAASLAEDKERGALDLLLTTPLADREIVLGKAAGRLGFILAAAATVLPPLLATMVFGGVDLEFILGGCAIVAATAMLATAIGVHAAVMSADLRGALLRAYGMTAALVGVVLFPTPFGVLALLEHLERSGESALAIRAVRIVYPGLEVAVAVGLLWSATVFLRHGNDRPPLPPRDDEADSDLDDVEVVGEESTAGWGPEEEYRFAPPRPMGLPPIDDDRPLLWKERFVGRPPRFPGQPPPGMVLFWLLGLVPVLMMIAGVALLVDRAMSPSPTGLAPTAPNDIAGDLLVSGGTLAAALYLVPAALALSATVARERRKQTLESLLAVPETRRGILRAKAVAALECGWCFLPLAAAAMGLAFAFDRDWPLGIAAFVAVLAGAVLVTGLAIWLSVRCPTEVRSLRLLVPAIVLAIGGPMGVWHVADEVRPQRVLLGMGTAVALSLFTGAAAWRSAARELDRLEWS